MQRITTHKLVNSLKQQTISTTSSSTSSLLFTTSTLLNKNATRSYSTHFNTLARSQQQNFHRYTSVTSQTPFTTTTRSLQYHHHKLPPTQHPNNPLNSRAQRFSSTQHPPQQPPASTTTTAQQSSVIASSEAVTLETSTATKQSIASTPNNTTIPPLSSQPTPTPSQEVVSSEMAQQLPTALPRFGSFEQFYKWYLVDPPTYQRYSTAWWMSNSWLMLMYSVTGYSALIIVRKVLSLFGINNVGLFKGDWQHRLLYFFMMTPTYSLMTLLYGYVFGRPVYGAAMVRRIWSRFFPWLKNQKKA